MTLARKLCGLVALAGSAAPAAAQYAPPRPTPQGPTRLVFIAPPWITNAPRTGIPGGPMPQAQPSSGQVSPAPLPLPAVAPTVPMVPAIPPAPPTVTPASGTMTRAVTRPDVWRPGTPTLPGTVVPAPAKTR